MCGLVVGTENITFVLVLKCMPHISAFGATGGGLPLMPQLLSLCKSLLWDTVSNALEKSSPVQLFVSQSQSSDTDLRG